ncbi:MAG: alpha/beta fold hydrolase [Cytophagales bacterium]|nr:MAG: alpha/beta fold hydrolase [Cytophagales bacterium]
MEVKQEKLKIKCVDGYELSAILLQPTEPKAVVQFNGGTGIVKEFYLNFLTHIASCGYVVLLYDYRGIGESRPASLKNFDAKMSDWGKKDMTDTLAWLNERFPDLPKLLMGHSMGGQQIGMMHNHHLLKGALLIATSTGVISSITKPYRHYASLMFNIYTPLVTAIFGYVPLKVLGAGEDLPKYIASEWISWCNNKHYLFDFIGKTLHDTHYDKVEMPIHAYIIEDDPIANSDSVADLLSGYKNAKISTEFIKVADYQTKNIGHLGLFSRKFKENLWHKPAKELDRMLGK